MIQKATWIIPGILVALLLGLLWALPITAAPSGADRGEVMIKSSESSKTAATYASPAEGPDAANPQNTIWVQVTDEDENEPTEYECKNVADVRLIAATATCEPRLQSDNAFTALHDVNEDGFFNREDVKVVGGTGYTLDTGNGTLDIKGTATSVKFSLNETDYVGKDAYLDEDAAQYDDDHVVIVSSGYLGKGVSVKLQETSRLSGVFGAYVTLNTAGTAAAATLTKNAMLPVTPGGDTVELTYIDGDPAGTRRTSVIIETDGPTFSNVFPSSGSAGTEDDPDFSIEITDGDSGIVDADGANTAASILLVFDLADAKGSRTASGIETDNHTVDRDQLDDEDSISDGFLVSASVRNPQDLDAGDMDDYEIHWWAIAYDAVGNKSVSDAVPGKALENPVEVKLNALKVVLINVEDANNVKQKGTITVNNETRLVQGVDADKTPVEVRVTSAFTRDSKSVVATVGDCLATGFTIDGSNDVTALAGCDPYVLNVDEAAPTLTGATAGNWLDVANKAPKSGPSGIRTSVEVVFSEPIDQSTVSADDFEVDNDTPSGVTTHADFADRVWLTVAEMDPDDTPKVEVVGSVTDMAGNTLDTTEANAAETTAADGIPAAITVMVSGTAGTDRPVTDKTITVTVSSDERRSGRPQVEIHQIKGDAVASSASNRGGHTSSTGATNEWEFTGNITAAGLYNVYVTTDGRDGIPVNKGVESTAVDAGAIEDGKTILFEVDIAVPTPAFTPANDESTDNPNTFIQVDFAGEGAEYDPVVAAVPAVAAVAAVPAVLSQDGKTVITAAVPAVAAVAGVAAIPKGGQDSYAMVTLTSATMDGPGYDSADVADMFSSRDNVLYVWRPGGLALGEYTLDLEYTDLAGNEGDASLDFKVTARAAYKLPLQPGSNLVSLPAAPENASIDDVFGGESAITLVMTFNNSTGLWQVASRGEDGMFMGDLVTISSRNAYWVVSDLAVDVSVLLQATGGLTVFPPAIEVYQGWNLVPVADVERSKAETVIKANTYFANIDWDIAYGYDPINGTYDKIAKSADADLKVGQGYFVYANEAGVIIP